MKTIETATAAETATVKILSVKEVVVNVSNNYYQTSRYVNHSTEERKLRLRFMVDGKMVIAHTPAIEVRVAKGFLNYETMGRSNNWFKVSDGELLGYRGAPMFDGGNGMNIAIQDTSKVIPSVEVGDEVVISFKKNEFGKMTHIKLIKK